MTSIVLRFHFNRLFPKWYILRNRFQGQLIKLGLFQKFEQHSPYPPTANIALDLVIYEKLAFKQTKLSEHNVRQFRQIINNFKYKNIFSRQFDLIIPKIFHTNYIKIPVKICEFLQILETMLLKDQE